MAIAATDTIWGTDRAKSPCYSWSSVSSVSSSATVVDGARVFVVGRQLGEVVEIGVAVLEIVDGVDAAAAAFLDRTARLVFLLTALLAPRSRLGAPADRSSRSDRGRPGPAAGTRTAEPAATEAAGPRTAKAAAAGRGPPKPPPPPPPKPPPPGRGPLKPPGRGPGIRPDAARRRPILAGARFADGEVAALERLLVELA